jgi:hypothetical protein
MSSSFGVNAVPFPLDPTEHRWVPRTPLGVSGFGHKIYPAVREFEMRFILSTTAEYWQLQQWFQNYSTGTAIIDLPAYAGSGYYFSRYSGCIVSEPEAGTYFNEHQTEMVLLISNIRT